MIFLLWLLPVALWVVQVATSNWFATLVNVLPNPF